MDAAVASSHLGGPWARLVFMLALTVAVPAVAACIARFCDINRIHPSSPAAAAA